MVNVLVSTIFGLTTLGRLVQAVPVGSQNAKVRDSLDNDFEVETEYSTFTSLRTIYKSKTAVPSALPTSSSGNPIFQIGSHFLFNDPFNPENVIFGANTLSPGAPAATVAGALVSVGFGNSIVIGPATIPFLGLPVPTVSFDFGFGLPHVTAPTTIQIPTGAPSSILSFSANPTSGLHVSTVSINTPATVTAVPTGQTASPPQVISSSSAMITSPSVIATSIPSTAPSHPSSTQGSPDMTCASGGESFTNGQTYMDSSGFTYTIHCSQDNNQPAYSMLSVSTGGFKRCFNACSFNPQCMGWTFSGSDSGTCYLKSKEGAYVLAPSTVVSAFRQSSSGSSMSHSDTSSSASASSSVGHSDTSSSAVQSSTSTPSASSSGSDSNCAALAAHGTIFTDKNGEGYKIVCKHDIGGNDLFAVSAPTFKDCFAACDAEPRCAGFAWLADDGPGTCYLKSSISGQPSISNADVAVRLNVPAGSTSAQHSSTSASILTTKSQISSTQVSSSSSTQASTQYGPSCQNIGTGNKYTSYYGYAYTVSCGVDHNGGDLSSAGSPSFTACSTACDTIDRCIGFAYVGGAGSGMCYFKSSLTSASANRNVDFAYKSDPSVLSTMHNMPTSTAMTSNPGTQPTTIVTVFKTWTGSHPFPSPSTEYSMVMMPIDIEQLPPTPIHSSVPLVEVTHTPVVVVAHPSPQTTVTTMVAPIQVFNPPVDHLNTVDLNPITHIAPPGAAITHIVGPSIPWVKPPQEEITHIRPPFETQYVTPVPQPVPVTTAARPSAVGPVPAAQPAVITGFNYHPGGSTRPFSAYKEGDAVRLMDGASYLILPYGKEGTFNGHYVQIAPYNDGVVIDRTTTIYYTIYTPSPNFVVPTPTPNAVQTIYSTFAAPQSTAHVTYVEGADGSMIPMPTQDPQHDPIGATRSQEFYGSSYNIASATIVAPVAPTAGLPQHCTFDGFPSGNGGSIHTAPFHLKTIHISGNPKMNDLFLARPPHYMQVHGATPILTNDFNQAAVMRYNPIARTITTEMGTGSPCDLWGLSLFYNAPARHSHIGGGVALIAGQSTGNFTWEWGYGHNLLKYPVTGKHEPLHFDHHLDRKYEEWLACEANGMAVLRWYSHHWWSIFKPRIDYSKCAVVHLATTSRVM